MWKGRFKTATADSMQRFSESISFDWRLYRHDIRGSIAHAAALVEAGIITSDEKQEIEAGLREIEQEIDAGTFDFKIELEDIHMNIESALTARIGDAGAKLHTARSRNDQIALDLRLYLRDETQAIIDAIANLQRALIDLAERSGDAIIPGYTHLQRAQPIFFAHHLLAYVEMLARDSGRFTDSLKRINVLPLGSGAIAGSTITLNRMLVADLLDFPEISTNSMDAVSDRDFAAEFLSTSALLGVHLSRLSEDIVVWASAEFGFIHLSDAYTTGSSLMPQKKNPDVAELTRGKTGRLVGNLMSLLTVIKGLPMTYNRDLQEDKEPVFDSIDTLKLTLEVFTGMISEAEANKESGNAAASDPILLATDLADYLVLKGVPFRSAHEIIGKLTALTVEKNTAFPDLAFSDYQALSPAFEEDVYDVLDVRKSLASRKSIGAPSPENVQTQLSEWKARLA